MATTSHQPRPAAAGTCPNCGGRVFPTDVQCLDCGAELHAPPAPRPAEPVAAVAPAKPLPDPGWYARRGLGFGMIVEGALWIGLVALVLVLSTVRGRGPDDYDFLMAVPGMLILGGLGLAMVITGGMLLKRVPAHADAAGTWGLGLVLVVLFLGGRLVSSLVLLLVLGAIPLAGAGVGWLIAAAKGGGAERGGAVLQR